MVIFDDVSKFILSHVSISIPETMAVGIIGASGAGKSTFLKLACGLLKPEKGHVYTLRKESVKRDTALLSQMGTVFADVPCFHQEQTVKEALEERACIYKMNRNICKLGIEYLGKNLGFLSFMDTPIRDLSLGQRRRAEIATAFLHNPKLVLLDEPLIGLDENAKTGLKTILKHYRHQGGTVIISSHNLEEVEDLIDRVLFLSKEKTLFYGNKDLLLRRYAPMDICEFEYDGIMPEFDDLPIEKYVISGKKITVSYNSNYLSSKELISRILEKTGVISINMKKSDISEVLRNTALMEK